MKDIFRYSKSTEELPFDLKITNDFPLQLTFLKTGSGNHILGYVTIWDGELGDPEIIFANIGEGTLIPSVSSFDFDKNISGAELDFFLINDGFNLNQNTPCFKDIIAGKGGRLAFIERCGEWQNQLRKNDGGELEWVDKESGDFVQEAVAANINSVNPLLVWIPDDDGEDVEILAGHIFHTFAKEGGALALNPDGFCHAKIYFDAMPDSLSFGFCEMLDPDSGLYNDVKFRLTLGEENVFALLPKTIEVEGALDEVDEREISSIIIKITDGFCSGDVLRPWMILVEEDGVVDGAGVSFTNLDKEGCLLLDGKAEKSVYESLLKHIRLCNLEGKNLKETRGLSLKIMTEGGEYNTTGVAIAERAGEVLYFKNEEAENRGEVFKKEEMKEEETEQEKEETEQEETLKTPLKNDDEAPLEKPEEKPLFRPSPLAASERKTVLITGAAKRVGKVLALAFAHDGWNVIIHCNTSLEDARALAKEVAKCKVRTAVLQADLGDESEVEQIFPQIFNVFDKVDLLVNCAAIFDKDDLFTSSEDSWGRHMMINLRAPVLLMRDFARQFVGKENGVGNIINIIDAGVLRTGKGFFSYSVSKAALLSATKLAALELAPNVKVNAVSPWQVMPSKYDNAKDFEALVEASPLGVNNSADEIYDTIKFILKTDSMTGQMITLDSGTFL